MSVKSLYGHKGIEYNGVEVVNVEPYSASNTIISKTREIGRLSHVIFPLTTEEEMSWESTLKKYSFNTIFDLFTSYGMPKKDDDVNYMCFHVGRGEENVAGFFFNDNNAEKNQHPSVYGLEASNIDLTDVKGMGLIFNHRLNQRILEKYPLSEDSVLGLIERLNDPKKIKNIPKTVKSVFEKTKTFSDLDKIKRGEMDATGLILGIAYLAGSDMYKNEKISKEQLQVINSTKNDFFWIDYGIHAKVPVEGEDIETIVLSGIKDNFDFFKK